MVYRWICEPIKYKPTKQHFGSNLYICVKAVQWPVWAWPWLRIYSQEESWKKIKSDRYLVSFPASNTFGRINKFTFFLVIPFSLFLSLFLTWHVVLHSIFRLLLIGQKRKKIDGACVFSIFEEFFVFLLFVYSSITFCMQRSAVIFDLLVHEIITCWMMASMCCYCLPMLCVR